MLTIVDMNGIKGLSVHGMKYLNRGQETPRVQKKLLSILYQTTASH